MDTINNKARIMVFRMDNELFEQLGELDIYDSLIWVEKFRGYADFELWVPLTDETVELLQIGNVLWTGGNNAGIIQMLETKTDTDGKILLNVKGRTLEALLLDRIVWGTFNFYNMNVSTVMYQMVNSQCINAGITERTIPYLKIADDENLGDRITIQKTGGEVYEFVEELAEQADLGFEIVFKPQDKEIVFTVLQSKNKLQGQTLYNPIEFDTELDDILSSSYFRSVQNEKNVTLVHGEETDTGRASAVSGLLRAKGFDRKEHYTDARDLQSTYEKEVSDGEGGTTTQTETIPAGEYNLMLQARGNEKLAEFPQVHNFEAQIKMFGDTQYIFGEDYGLGDYVSIRDRNIGVVLNAQITEIQDTYSQDFERYLTFGYSQPTLYKRIKRNFG